MNANGVSAASNVASIQTPVGAGQAGGADGVPAGERCDGRDVDDDHWLLRAVVHGDRRDELRRLLRHVLESAEDRDRGAAGRRVGVHLGTMYQAVTWNTKKTYYWSVVAKNAGGCDDQRDLEVHDEVVVSHSSLPGGARDDGGFRPSAVRRRTTGLRNFLVYKRPEISY